MENIVEVSVMLKTESGKKVMQEMYCYPTTDIEAISAVVERSVDCCLKSLGKQAGCKIYPHDRSAIESLKEYAGSRDEEDREMEKDQMDTRVKTLTQDEVTISMFAFRYALGRQTYAPSLVVEHITRHLESFTEADVRQIIKEIEEADEQKRLGATIDRKTWVQFRHALEDKLDELGGR